MLHEGWEMGNESLCTDVDDFDVRFSTQKCKIILQSLSAPSPGSTNKVHEEGRGLLEQSGQGWEGMTEAVQGAPRKGLGTVALLHLSAMLLGHCACTVLALWLPPGLPSAYRGLLVPRS